MDKVNAYIDESGDPDFNDSASEVLEYSAVLFNDLEIPIARDKLLNLLEIFSLTELKSRAINSETKRIGILESIQDLNFKFINLVIDKRKVESYEWVRYRKTFYKFSQKLINEQIHKYYPTSTVTIDRFGSQKYQESLKKYLEKQFQIDLFQNEIFIKYTDDEILLQFADFIAGTHKKLDAKEFRRAEEIHDLLKNKELFIVKWPENFVYFDVSKIESTQDKMIADIAISFAEEYITTQNSHQYFEQQKIVLSYLIFQVNHINFERYIHTYELIDWLKQRGHILSDEEFRSNIIGPMRDAGVIIISSSRGYKIPISESDIAEYINYNSSKFLPMIRRFRSTYRTLHARAQGEITLFDSGMFEKHKKLFDALD